MESKIKPGDMCPICEGTGKEGSTGKNCVGCAGTKRVGEFVCPNCKGEKTTCTLCCGTGYV